MNDIWVVNASPIIALAKADRLHLLTAEVFKALRAAGLHLNDEVARSALRGVGETWESTQ